ncbi:MAG: ribonuclease Z [Bacteroidetes bacterium]|nr:ribonuclease Z [Bacteroidota bacterium]
MTFSVTILGSNSAIPTLTRNPSAHLLNVNERLFLIDCAEGTQLQIRKFHVHFQRIQRIFISHLHGDHFFGLIGLLNTFHLLGRKEEIHLYGPPQLKEILDLQLEVSLTTLNYPLLFYPLSFSGFNLIHEDEKVTVHSFPLLHSIPTCGFLFREKTQLRKIRKKILTDVDIPVSERHNLKLGKDFVDAQGRVFRNDELTQDPPSPRSYAYCSDTAYTESIVPFIRGCDLLYHETTFMQNMAASAREKLHSTTLDAATLAKKAGVKKLMIGHFSARYDEIEPLLEETRSVFPGTILAEDGITIAI